MGRSQILGHSAKESIYPISIGSTVWSCLQSQIQIEIWMGQRLVIISPSTECYMYLKKQFSKFKKIITSYKNNWEQNTIKGWAQLSTSCCICFWQSSICKCISIKRSIVLGLHLRTIICKRKLLCVYIYTRTHNNKKGRH